MYVRDAKGCVVTKMITIGYDAIDEAAAAVFSAYPNPFASEIVISFKAAGNSDIQVINTLGQTIYTGRSDAGGETSINTADWTAGPYVLLVYKDGRVYSTTLVKN